MTINVLNKEVKQKVVVLNKLSEDFIVGMDMISQHRIYFDPVNREFHWNRPQEWIQGHAKLRKAVKLAPLSVTTIPVQLSTESGMVPDATHTAIVNIGHHQNPYLTGGPYLVTADNQGSTWLPVYNCSPVEIELPHGDFIGLTENVKGCQMTEVNPAYIAQVAQQQDRRNKTIPPAKEKLIREKFCSEVED